MLSDFFSVKMAKVMVYVNYLNKHKLKQTFLKSSWMWYTRQWFRASNYFFPCVVVEGYNFFSFCATIASLSFLIVLCCGSSPLVNNLTRHLYCVLFRKDDYLKLRQDRLYMYAQTPEPSNQYSQQINFADITRHWKTKIIRRTFKVNK